MEYNKDYKRWAMYCEAAYNNADVPNSKKLWSNGEVTIFEEREFYVAVFRGTQITSIRDLMADADIALNYVLRRKHGVARYIKNKWQLEETIAAMKLYRKKFILTGHSLGGGIASYVMDTNYPLACYAYLFNSPGAGFDNVPPKLEATQWYIDGDPVSTFRDKRVKQIVLPRNPDINSHTIKQFL